MGGLLAISGEVFGLTVAHPFEMGIEPMAGTQRMKALGLSRLFILEEH
jgi:hypothetical protein